MSHFVGAVIIPTDLPIDLKVTQTSWTPHVDINPELQSVLTMALEDFNENHEVEEYVDIEDGTEELERAKVSTFMDIQPGQTDLEILTEWSGEGWREEDGKLVHYTTYNENSKWDWYQVGGRWEELYRDKQGESLAELRDLAAKNSQAIERETGEMGLFGPVTELVLGDEKIDYLPYTVVVPQEDGTFAWLEKGAMGWFGLSSGDLPQNKWGNTVLDATSHITGPAKVVYVDFHI